MKPTITRDESALTILVKAIARLTISCSIPPKCIHMGFIRSRSIEKGTSRVLRKLIPGRNVLPATTSLTSVCLASILPEMQRTNHCEEETSQRPSINRGDDVTHFTLTFTTSATLYGRSL